MLKGIPHLPVIVQLSQHTEEVSVSGNQSTLLQYQGYSYTEQEHSDVLPSERNGTGRSEVV